MSFTPNNINEFNKLFYTKAKKKLIDELPDLFTKLDLFNVALHKHIIKKINSKKISIFEIASGKKMDRWNIFIQQDEKRKWQVLLTDFDKTLFPNVNNLKIAKNFKSMANFQLKTSVYNLFNDFPKFKKMKNMM